MDVLRDFIEEDWHFGFTLPLKNKGVESVEESLDVSDLRSQDSWSVSDSESGSLSRTSTNSSVSSSGRSMDGIEGHASDLIIRTTSEMKRVFETYDENKDGQICKRELASFMEKLDVQVSEEELTSMIKSVDKNGDGFVDFDEFLELHTSLVDGDDQPETSGKIDEDEELFEAFKVFDKNEDGFICVRELQLILRRLGINEGVRIQDCEEMISAVDKNNDGRVDFAEFKQLMVNFPSDV